MTPYESIKVERMIRLEIERGNTILSWGKEIRDWYELQRRAALVSESPSTMRESLDAPSPED